MRRNLEVATHAGAPPPPPPRSDLVPLGQLKSGFNYDTTEKRVLNFDNVVDDSDNVKQDMSIDVYGRKDKSEDAPAPAAGEEEEEEADELDSLLSG